MRAIGALTRLALESAAIMSPSKVRLFQLLGPMCTLPSVIIAPASMAAFALALRLRFAGEVAFICPAAAGDHHAVGSDALAVVGAQNIADLHLVQRQILPMAVALHAHLCGCELEQQPQAVEALFLARCSKYLPRLTKPIIITPDFEIHMRHAVMA